MDLKNLYRISVFQKVVEQGNFTRAANELHLSKSVVSQHVSELERDLKVRLLNRSTRSVSVTQEGYRLAEAASMMIHLVDTACRELEQEQDRPTGLIRITASQNFAVVYLVDAVLRFRKEYPEIEIEIDSRDFITNIVETGYDIAFRIGWLKSTELHVVKICDFEMVPCASAGHIEQFGEVTTPLDLALRPWVSLTIMPDFDRLILTSRNDDVTVRVSPVLRTNSGLTAKLMVLDGNCVGLLPDYAIRNELKSGRIVRLLPEWSHRPGEIAATYVHRERMPPRLRVFLDFLKQDARAVFPKIKT